MKGKKVLRVDRKFRSHGPAKLKRLYRRRSAVERVTSRLKHYFGLKHLRTRGLRNHHPHASLHPRNADHRSILNPTRIHKPNAITSKPHEINRVIVILQGTGALCQPELFAIDCYDVGDLGAWFDDTGQTFIFRRILSLWISQSPSWEVLSAPRHRSGIIRNANLSIFSARSSCHHEPMGSPLCDPERATPPISNLCSRRGGSC